MTKLFCVCIFLMCLSCKKNTQESNEDIDTTKTQTITEKDIAKLNYLDFAIDDRVKPIIESWLEYHQLEEIIENVKKGDLFYFKNNAKENMKTLISDIRETIPITLKTPSILARITVLETKLYKTESLSNLSTTKKEELINTLKELLVAFSNLNFQLNKKLEIDSQNIQKPI